MIYNYACSSSNRIVLSYSRVIKYSNWITGLNEINFTLREKLANSEINLDALI